MRVRRQWKAWQVSTAIVVWLALLTAVLVWVNQPALALSFLSLVPICVAAFRFGVVGAVLVAALSGLLFAAKEVFIRRSEALQDTTNLLLAIGSRLVVFFAVGVLVAELLRRQDMLTRTVAGQEREIEELASIRDALTPVDVPDVPGLQLATAYKPAEGHVSGDFFLVVPGADGTVLLVVGDVVGHGLEAARRAAFARATLASFANYVDDPAELLRLTNVALYKRGESDFVTATCLRMDLVARQLMWAQAGHSAPWDIDTAQPVGNWPPSPPLGVRPDFECVTRHASLDLGGGVLLFSDGLMEARPVDRARRGPGLGMFGEDAVRQELQRHRGASPEDLVSALMSAASDFVEGPMADDLTLLAARTELAAG